MGKSQSKKAAELEGDSKFMEHLSPGCGQICPRWMKHHNFSGKLVTQDILELQTSLKLEIMKEKKARRKKVRQKEYECSNKRLEQSKARDRTRSEKQRKREEKKVFMVEEEDETPTQRGQRRRDRVDAAGTDGEGKRDRAPSTPQPNPGREARKIKLSPPPSSPPTKTKYNLRKGNGESSIYPVTELRDHVPAYRDGKPKCEPSDSEEDEEELFQAPMVQVANPRYGAKDAQGHEDPRPTIEVFRPWSHSDMRKALDGITDPKTDVDECVDQLKQLFSSFRLNGNEVYRALLMLNGFRWVAVRGDFTGAPANGMPYPPEHPDLLTDTERVFTAMQAQYARRADYGKINDCAQREGEDPPDYRSRLEVVFRKHSGIPYDADDDSAFQQQLKTAFVHGLQDDVKSTFRNTGS